MHRNPPCLSPHETPPQPHPAHQQHGGRRRPVDPYAIILMVELGRQIAALPPGRRPVATLAMMGLNALPHFASLLPAELHRLVPGIGAGCLQPAAILDGRQWGRLLWSPFLHGDDVSRGHWGQAPDGPAACHRRACRTCAAVLPQVMHGSLPCLTSLWPPPPHPPAPAQYHLYYNMASLLAKGVQLEGRLGPLRFSILTAWLLVLSQALYVGVAAALAAAIPEYRQARRGGGTSCCRPKGGHA